MTRSSARRTIWTASRTRGRVVPVEEMTLFERMWILAMGPGDDRGRPNPKACNERWYPGNSSAASGSIAGWHSLVLPKNAGMVMIVAAGGGGAGGPGFAAASSSAKGGGGGGGSGSTATLIIPAAHLPRALYVIASSSPISPNGTPWSQVADTPFTTNTAASTIVFADGGNAGAVGTAAAGGGSGSGGSAMTAANAAYLQRGTWTSLAGNQGGAGGAITPVDGTSVTWGGPAGTPFTGGAGGGSASAGNSVSNGGAVNGSGRYVGTSVPGGTGVAGGPGNPGAGGANLGGPSMSSGAGPFVAFGGGGGGAAATAGLGGLGGLGGWCCGGGGGGAGVTGGLGGPGGIGFVYITWW